MIPLESMPILIAADRQYVRDLIDPRAVPEQGPSRRERLGGAIVRFGHWVANHRPPVPTAPAPTPSPA